MALPTFGLQSCLDYDNPGDEFNSTTKNVEKVTSRGDVDKIPFRQATDAAAAGAALTVLTTMLSTRLFLILSSSTLRFVWHHLTLLIKSVMVVHGVHSQR